MDDFKQNRYTLNNEKIMIEEKQPEITEEIIEEIEIKINPSGGMFTSVKIVTGIDFDKYVGWK